MYIIKNALQNIRRSKGRSILFGIIIFIIALSCCLALSIRQAAQTTRENGLKSLKVTANITLDMDKLFSSGTRPDKSTLKENMQNSSLSLTQLQKYANLSSVNNFYYTDSLSADASKIDAVSSDSQFGNRGPQDSSSGDFTILGCSSDDAMTAFTEGTAKISKGSLFKEGTTAAQCVISSTLASYNDLSVGDTITFKDPDKSSTTYKVKIVGIYKTTSSSEAAGSGMQPGSGSNTIYMSYAALKKIADAKDLSMNTQGTYAFASYSKYKQFKSQVKDAGLSSKYTVESQDVNTYLRELQPLTNLSKYARIFLILVLAIGGTIIVVLTLFSIRERKYDIGVLVAIGMNKRKIGALFISEIAAIAIVAIIAGGIIGGFTSVPVTNKLLSSQSVTTSQDFRHGSAAPPSQNSSDSSNQNRPPDSSGSKTGKGGPLQTISKVTSAANATVILELAGIGVLLVLVAGGASVIWITRYDPLEILTNRD
ncbi:MAG: ABC transporter permease [Anaerovoracaceae bacterium]|jgi:putative ABC transport system permease protein